MHDSYFVNKILSVLSDNQGHYLAMYAYFRSVTSD